MKTWAPSKNPGFSWEMPWKITEHPGLKPNKPIHCEMISGLKKKHVKHTSFMDVFFLFFFNQSVESHFATIDLGIHKELSKITSQQYQMIIDYPLVNSQLDPENHRFIEVSQIFQPQQLPGSMLIYWRVFDFKLNQ